MSSQAKGSDGAEAASPVGSVDKALRVIERLAAAGVEGVSLVDLAAELELNKATLHHTLSALRFRHWAEQTDAGSYRLGSASELAARWWNAGDHEVTMLHSVLQRISADSTELVHLGRLSERSVVYLDKVEPPLALRVWSKIGVRAPAARTALGRAILGARGVDAADLDLWVKDIETKREGFERRTLEQLRSVRTNGYAWEREENEKGITCVAVPIRVAGSAQDAISISAPVSRMSTDRMHELAQLIAHHVRDAELTGVETVFPVASQMEGNNS